MGYVIHLSKEDEARLTLAASALDVTPIEWLQISIESDLRQWNNLKAQPFNPKAVK